MPPLVTALLVSATICGSPCGGRLVGLGDPVLLPLEAPQDVAVDATDGSLWITSGLSNRVLHLDASLGVLGWLEAPFEEFGRHGVTGIAWHPDRDTLFLVQPALEEIWELAKDGTPTGHVISLAQIPRPVNIIPRPFVKGIVVDPDGDLGRSSIWLVEGVMTAIYEITLDGDILRSFCHPDDRDGCPGLGMAARSNGIALRHDGGRIEIVGTADGPERILRVDLEGLFVGAEFPLVEIGGRAGGFCHGLWRPPGSVVEQDAVFVTVESSAELHVLEMVEPELLPILDLSCELSGESVELTWEGLDGYERIEVIRDGALLASLPGPSTTYEDTSPLEGVTSYEVVAIRGACDSRLACSIVLGQGQVLRSVLLDARSPIDITEDGDGNLWITDLQNRILIHDRLLGFITEFPGPFEDEGDQLTGIAYNPDNDTVFVYNATTNEVAEIDMTGALASLPFPSGVTGEPEDESDVASMLYDPDGAGGEGSFWYLDYTTATIQERTRAGELLRQCLHPDWVAEPTPDGAPFEAYTGGMSAVPGHGFSRLALAGGQVRDGRITRVLNLDTDSYLATGEDVPVEGIAAFATPYHIGIHETSRNDRPLAYVVVPDYPQGHFLEVEVRAPPVPRLTNLICSQPTAVRTVHLEFANPGGLDAVEVLRDRAPLATLGGDATSFEDLDVPAGDSVYALRAWNNGEHGDEVECSLRVGPGSIEAREFTHPASLLHQVSLDPVTGGFIGASRSGTADGALSRFDADLRFRDYVPSPFVSPMKVAALAVRDVVASTEIHALGWNPGAASGTQYEFPVRVLDAAGNLLKEYSVAPPRPRGRFVSFPSGMGWDSGTDTFWLLERNSATLTNFRPDGEVLSVFAHPARIHQDNVYDYGLAVDGSRGALYLAGAGPLDHRITRIVEVTRFGTLTGVEIPVGAVPTSSVWGFALDSTSTGIVAFSLGNGVQDLVLHRAFDPILPVRDLACTLEGETALLSWSNDIAYESITVWRDGAEVATLDGAETGWIDGSDSGPGVYRVCGSLDGLTSAGAICGPVFSRPFLRGDAEENGQTNISDAIAILGYLFLGGEAPLCLDAADVNDSGNLDITDGIALLGFLFLSGPPPEEPYPYSGLDLTVDGLECRG